jgi:hypothetical protein
LHDEEVTVEDGHSVENHIGVILDRLFESISKVEGRGRGGEEEGRGW